MRLLKNKQKGVSLVEMLVYVFILTLLLIVIVSVLGSVAGTQRRFASTKAIEISSANLLERMTREIRAAESINGAQSVFNANPSYVTLNSLDELGNPRTVKFELINGAIHIVEDNVDQGPLTQDRVTVSNFVIREITTANSVIVKIELTLSAGADQAARSEVFYATAGLRGSY